VTTDEASKRREELGSDVAIGDILLSITDIARAADVSPGAVSTWRHRGPGFPDPVPAAGRRRFRAREVAEFLDGRRIPENARKEGEPHGITYGERFRRNLGLSDPRARTAAARGTHGRKHVEETLDELLWEPLQSWRGFFDPVTYQELLLSMLLLRGHNPTDWADLVHAATRPDRPGGIALLLERTIRACEAANPDLRGALPTVSPLEWQDQHLAAIIRILDRVITPGASDQPLTADPAIVSSFLLDRFATTGGERGGEFFTPAHLVRLMVEMTSPGPSERICDPCCGSGDTLVGAVNHVTREFGGSSAPPVFGQVLGGRSWKLAKLNLAIHAVAADLGSQPANALHRDLHQQQRFDVVLTNPPFNMSGWSDGSVADDPRWRYGTPPEHNANYAWLQHVASMLSEHGRAAVLMPNGASDSQSPRERAIRAAMVDGGVVECIIALPPKLFPSTAIPVTLWLLQHPSSQTEPEILMVDATGTGTMVDRTHRVLTNDDINRIISTYRKWRSGEGSNVHDGVPGLSRCVSVEEIKARGYSLNPRGYVTSPAATVDTEQALQTLQRLEEQLQHLDTRSRDVNAHVERLLRGVGVWKP
jgi:type I restriction enzyme M protein